MHIKDDMKCYIQKQVPHLQCQWKEEHITILVYSTLCSIMKNKY